MGNMLVIILFAREKKLRKKSLFLVMNMALADVLLGAVSLPLFVYLLVGPYYHLWAAKTNAAMVYSTHFLDTMRGHRGFLLEVPSHAVMFSPRPANPT